MLEELNNAVITVEGVTSKPLPKGGNVYTVLAKNPEKPEKPTKFTIWPTKTDGSASAAFTALNTLRPMAGDKLDIGYSEKEKTFTGKTGELVKYTERTIRAMKAATPTNDPEIKVEDIPF